jgi:hypothetical protein
VQAYDVAACNTVRANRWRQWVRISEMHLAGLLVVRVAADASVQIHGTAYFAIRIRLASVDRKTSSLVNLHLAAPPLSLARTLASPSTI